MRRSYSGIPAIFFVLLAVGTTLANSSPDPENLLNQARDLHIAGDLNPALKLYLEALERFRQEGNDAGTALCLNNASVILLFQGEFERALSMAREAVDLRRSIGDTRRMGRSLTNAARVLHEMGLLGEAADTYQRALEAARSVEDRRDMVLNFLNLGVVSQDRGFYGEALASIRGALDLIEAEEEASWTRQQELFALNNRGALYERIGEYRLALADYKRILGIVGTGIESVPYMINSAAILRNLGDPNLAMENLKKAESILLDTGGDPILHANLLSNIGLILYQNLNRVEEALPVLVDAFAEAKEAGDRVEAMTIGNYLGAAYLYMEDPGRAEEIYLQVLSDRTGDSIPEPAWESHLGLAKVWLKLGERAAAIRALRTSAALIEGSRLDLAAEMEPRRFLEERLAVYALLSGSLAGGGGREEILAGLRTVERARERLLMARWRRIQRRKSAVADGGHWKGELALLEAEAIDLYENPDERGVEIWSERADRWEGRSLVSLPSSTGPGEAWIEFLVVGDESRVFWMTREGFGSLALPGENEIERLCTDWLEALTGNSSGEKSEIDRGFLLYQSVLAPVLAALPPGIGRLRVVPDGPLWKVPLDALPIGKTAGGRTLRLIQDYELTLVPLLSTLRRDDLPEVERGETDPAPYLFFGPPEREPAGSDGGEENLWTSLPPLPEAEKEAEILFKTLGKGGMVFHGAAAREQIFRERVRSPLSVLHLATHAIADPIDMGRTGILFHRERREEGGGADGFLSLPEILGLDLSVNLTFLSACSGAVGASLPGEGLASLAGGLLESGSRAVIASLWDVEDLPTRILVEQFYHRLGRGGTFSSALREAKLAQISAGGELTRPRHWAAWILVGDGGGALDRHPLRKNLQRFLIIGSLVVLAAVLYGARRRSVRAPDPQS